MPKRKDLGNRIRVKHIHRELDIDKFNKLTDVLYEAFKGNKSACARALGISTPTWNKWLTDPPTWPYWNYVLRAIILDVCSDLLSRNSSANRKHKNAIIKSLSAIDKDDPIHSGIDIAGYETTAAYSHLRFMLMKKGMFVDEIMTTANMGGFSRKMLERASEKLGIVKTLEGFGKHKRSYWRLPNEDDD